MQPCPAAFPLRFICFASDFLVGDTGGFVPFSLTLKASLLTYEKKPEDDHSIIPDNFMPHANS